MVVSSTGRASRRAVRLQKAPTGIKGLDEITGGGLPRGRPTLVCGGAGCGKTLLAMEFLVRGATEYDDPGVFVTFEESQEDLMLNVASLGVDLKDLIAGKRLVVEHVHIERSEIREAGEYDLEGLFIRLGLAIDAIGARRVVLDTIEVLFGGLSDQLILRAELRRLFRWLKDKGVTAVITGESGTATLTRQGLEEYVSDCVIVLDHRVVEQVSSRRLRVVKYRGSMHGTDEYPFLIDQEGIAVLPITSVGLTHAASTRRVSSGVPALDAMLGGAGYFRGSSVLVSGTAGTGKSSISAHFAAAACRRDERVLYFAFEESGSQIMRNMRSIGIDLATPLKAGTLCFEALRPTASGLEMHLIRMRRKVLDFRPQVVVIDPLNSFATGVNDREVKTMLTRLIDFLKNRQITAVLTNLTAGGSALEHTDVAISSMIDTWLVLRDTEIDHERTRILSIVKSRGMAHSNRAHRFLLTSGGIVLLDPPPAAAHATAAAAPRPAARRRAAPTSAEPRSKARAQARR